MFKRWKKLRWHRLEESDTVSSLLHFSTEDRATATATPASNELVDDLYGQAQKKAKDLPRGAEVSVELANGQPTVHFMELLVSLTRPGLTEKYGLQFTHQFNNSVHFKKV